MKSTTKLGGFIYCFDPELHHLILIQLDAEKKIKTCLVVFGHSINQIQILEETCPYSLLEDSSLLSFASSSKENNAEVIREIYKPKKQYPPEILQKKLFVFSTLQKNRMNVVEENDSLLVMGNVYIDPPYDSSSCHGSNRNLLNNIQSLLVNQERELITYDD